jgi:hypothetical protein
LLSSSMIVSSLLLISILALETAASIQQSTVVGLFSAESAAEGSTDATPPCRHDGPVHNALKLLTDCSRRRSNNVEGGGGHKGGVADAQAFEEVMGVPLLPPPLFATF